jgi:hypothetical protein
MITLLIALIIILIIFIGLLFFDLREYKNNYDFLSDLHSSRVDYCCDLEDSILNAPIDYKVVAKDGNENSGVFVVIAKHKMKEYTIYTTVKEFYSNDWDYSRKCAEDLVKQLLSK